MIAGVTKFTSGAWVSLPIIVAFTTVALLTRRDFDGVVDATALGAEAAPPPEEREETPSQLSNLAVVLVPYLNRPTMRALAFATSLRQPVLALHVTPTDEEAKRFQNDWDRWAITSRSR